RKLHESARFSAKPCRTTTKTLVIHDESPAPASPPTDALPRPRLKKRPRPSQGEVRPQLGEALQGLKAASTRSRLMRLVTRISGQGHTVPDAIVQHIARVTHSHVRLATLADYDRSGTRARHRAAIRR